MELMKTHAWLLFGYILFTSLGNAFAGDPLPGYYSAPGLDPHRDYHSQHFNEFIDPFTGRLQLHYVDIFLPGNGSFDLRVQRSYTNPDAAFTGRNVNGKGWTMHFGRVLKGDSDICSGVGQVSVLKNPVLELPDGGTQLLYHRPGQYPLYLTAARWAAECATGGAGLIVTSPEGVRYEMTHLANVGTMLDPEYAWYAKRITDRNGNYFDVTYSTNPNGYLLIKSVMASDGREVSFSYFDELNDKVRLQNVSTSGQTWSYDYAPIPGLANQFFLTRVTRPDGAAWQYAYNANIAPAAGSYAINGVTYPQGGTLNYGYTYMESTDQLTLALALSQGENGLNQRFHYAPDTDNRSHYMGHFRALASLR